MSSINHAGFAGYLLRARLNPDSSRADGAVALVFDSTLRVLLHPANRGDIVLEAQVTTLPDRPAAADEVLETALTTAGERPGADADTLVLSQDQQKLLLQQRIASDVSADEFEKCLGNFLDSLTGWRAQLGTL